jgi:hypothetical protein
VAGRARAPGLLETAIVYVDSFGNIKLVGEVGDLEAAVGELAPATRCACDGRRIRRADRRRALVRPSDASRARRYYEDAYGRICLAANQASGAKVLGLQEGLSFSLSRA